ncbi:polysaccharide deacetylase family protein [Mobilicoccus pelagius]|uniref:Putative polysaccharide deacetylase n=1 Tax=Mobilicoccus pelagius NBRC 104925 TaxID=1089455 RepID=H5UN05_9MICO|nr:polysaccharide deacetylase family protein [Mobilicoccus pelagius]GAB47113.1 putative polysaccharide deacetylase [Mobilicoccus pelagius NBRC 104925]
MHDAVLVRVLSSVGLAVALAGCGATGPATQDPATTPAAGSSDSTTPAPPAAPPTPSPATPTTISSTTAVTTPAAPTTTGPIDRAVQVRVHAPVYDSPGALVPIIPTARGARSFDVSVGGRRGECTGDTWTHATGTAQQCWITIPEKGGRATIDVRAHLTNGHDAVGTQPIEGKGVPGSPVDAATRDRILHCGNTSDDVWLTFDDGFLSDATMNRVLDTLERENVRARFFATGQWSRANPAMTAALLRAGHLVENHTDTHESLNAIDDAALRRQIDRGPATDATLVRPGFGAGAFTTRVSAAAERAGQKVCYWDVDTRDWAGPSAEEITERVLRGDRSTPPARPGSVVLMHMTGKHTPEALPGLIRGLRAKGLTLPALHS